MRAVLMAAGIGSRISREISKPKSLLDVGGKSLIRHTVELLLSHNIDVTIVVGYKKELFFEDLAGLPVDFVVNPFYRVSNSVASLWFAREYLREDTDYLFGNADVFFEEEILKLLLDSPEETVLLSDTRRAKVGDYLFGLTEDGYIAKYGKEIPMEDRDCEYVGLGKVKSTYMKRFVEIMEEMVNTENYQTWWEVILYDHCTEQPVKALDVAPYFWSEIDYIEDYMKIVDYTRKPATEPKQSGGEVHCESKN